MPIGILAAINSGRVGKEKRKDGAVPDLPGQAPDAPDFGLAFARSCRLAGQHSGATMHQPISPPTIHPPFSAYSNGVEVPPGQRLVFCSGQLGITRSGDIPPTAGEQAELAFDNIAAILAEAGMGLENVIRINAFVTDRAHLRPYMDVRNRRFGAPLPASTLMIVAGLARPEFVVEIEVVAAGPAAVG